MAGQHCTSGLSPVKQVVELCLKIRAGGGNQALDTSRDLSDCSIGNWRPGTIEFVCTCLASSGVKLPL